MNYTYQSKGIEWLKELKRTGSSHVLFIRDFRFKSTDESQRIENIFYAKGNQDKTGVGISEKVNLSLKLLVRDKGHYL